MFLVGCATEVGVADEELEQRLSVSASPAAITVAQGTAAHFAITTTGIGSIRLTTLGAPEAAGSFSPTTVDAGGASTLTIATSSARTGTYAITVRAITATGSASTAITLTVVARNDFSIAASPGSVTIAPGATGSIGITTAVLTGNAQSISLSVAGLPAGASAGFSPSLLTAGASSVLTIAAGPTAVGTYPIVITGTGATASHAVTVNLTIAEPIVGDFSIAATPSGIAIAQGATGTIAIGTATLTGSPQLVSLSVSGLPAGATAMFTPTSVVGGMSAALVVDTGSAATGIYVLTITGAAVSGSHATTVTLVVTGA